MKSFEGFIQIPILLTILVGLLGLGSVAYFEFHGSFSPQGKNASTTEASTTTQEQAALDSDTAVQIQELKQEIQNLKDSKANSNKTSTGAPAGATQVAPTVTPSIAPSQQNSTPQPRLSILSFSISPSSGYYGDAVTFTWSSQGAVSCAVPVLDPSKLGVPFTGHLPSGNLSYTYTDLSQPGDTTFWIVCADKDWNTITSSTSFHSLPPEIVGNPYYLVGDATKVLYLSFKGAPSAHVSCVADIYSQNPNATKVIDSDALPSGSVKFQSNPPNGGAQIDCVLDFGSGRTTSFTALGI